MLKIDYGEVLTYSTRKKCIKSARDTQMSLVFFFISWNRIAKHWAKGFLHKHWRIDFKRSCQAESLCDTHICDTF